MGKRKIITLEVPKNAEKNSFVDHCQVDEE